MHALARRLLLPACFALLAVIVFATQFAGTGFGGRHQNEAWVPSHALAIASRATPLNGFVGHARSFLDAEGAPDYQYLDRYPVFFSALLGALTGLTDDLATKVWIARQLMHLLFILTMLFAWLLLRRLGQGRRLALAGVALVFSGHMLLRYREMIHFDQPALLGMMILLYVIAQVKLESRGRRRRLTLATLLAVSLGRGFLSLGVLGLWAAVEALGLLWQRERPLAQRLHAILRHDATRMLLLALAWLALMLAWNLAQEMARRDVPFAGTSIAHSMGYRLPGGQPKTGWQADYPAFAARMESRLLLWFTPLERENVVALQRLLPLPLLLLVVYHHLRRQAPAGRIVILLTAFSGLAWLFVMINLTWFHDYTTMHALGFALAIWLALSGPLKQQRLINALLVAALAIFLFSALDVEGKNRDWHEPAAIYTDDYNRILQRIGARGSVVYSDPARQDRIINIPEYVLSFYLGDNYLATDVADADYMVANRDFVALPASDGAGLLLHETLTPAHSVGFLFDLRGQASGQPQDLAPRYNFGNAVTLGRWELLDSVQAQPCQRVRVASWWQAPAPPPANYHLLLALTDADGNFLASADGAPVSGDTQAWEPDAWYPDGRSLRVPCDAAPGEYSLIFSVYDPQTDAENDKLRLIHADGGAGDTWLYLTTLFVN